MAIVHTDNHAFLCVIGYNLYKNKEKLQINWYEYIYSNANVFHPWKNAFIPGEHAMPY